MSKAARVTDIGGARKTGGEVLHFLTRTLQAHVLDAEPQDILAKLKNLQTALDQQESTLLGLPESASKIRMCEALAKAKDQVARIFDHYNGTARENPLLRQARTR